MREEEERGQPLKSGKPSQTMQVTPEAGRRAAETLRAIRMERFTLEGLLSRMWELRDNLTAYDAAYVALAEHLDVPLITRDTRIAAAPRHRAQVRVI